MISGQEARQASARPLGLSAKPSYTDNRYPAYIDLVRRHLARDYREEDLQSEGLRIFTTLNPEVQQAAEKAATDTLPRLASGEVAEALEAAVVVTAKDTGEVLALVGGAKTPPASPVLTGQLTPGGLSVRW